MKEKKWERVRQRSRRVVLSATKVRMTAMVPEHPLVAKNWVHSVECLSTFLSLQTSFEREVDIGFCQGCQGMRRDQVCPSSNETFMEEAEIRYVIAMIQVIITTTAKHEVSTPNSLA